MEERSSLSSEFMQNVCVMGMFLIWCCLRRVSRKVSAVHRLFFDLYVHVEKAGSVSDSFKSLHHNMLEKVCKATPVNSWTKFAYSTMHAFVKFILMW